MFCRKTSIVFILFCLFNSLSSFAYEKLTLLERFGDNPGELTARYFVPEFKGPALVVMLHGCAQSGEQLAEQSGLMSFAQQKNIALLIPQQDIKNNIKQCFNWFSNQDIDKNQGESLSIKNMILSMKQMTGAEDVYIIGLSAGGAMVSSLLVNYPDLFKAGAIIAGISYPCADNLIKAISCMRSGPAESPQALAEQVKKLQGSRSHWPRLSIWTGDQDSIVAPKNAQALSQLWRTLNQIKSEGQSDNKKGVQITRWYKENKTPHVELITITNIDHGWPVNPLQEYGGEIGPFLLSAPLSATTHIMNFFLTNKNQVTH